jgi:uroporphyrinogen-III synthase
LYVIQWNIFCLSGKTKQAVLNAKWLDKNIIDEAVNASELAKKIIGAGIDEIIFFCGSKRRDELPTILKTANIKIHEVVLYETTETPVTVDGYLDAVLFFSPSGVQSFFSSNELSNSTICFAIGATTATSVSTFTQNKVVTSIAPDQGELIKEVIEHFKQKSPVR